MNVDEDVEHGLLYLLEFEAFSDVEAKAKVASEAAIEFIRCECVDGWSEFALIERDDLVRCVEPVVVQWAVDLDICEAVGDE